MWIHRSIEIDFEVHKMIENERRGFGDPPLAALRRLLGLEGAPVSVPTLDPEAELPGRSWEGDGVALPHGTDVRMRYNYKTHAGRIHEGRIVDGQWFIEGSIFNSPSAAANAISVTKNGPKTQINGWNYWEVRFPGKACWEPLRGLQP
jgi:hypothetical protein